MNTSDPLHRFENDELALCDDDLSPPPRRKVWTSVVAALLATLAVVAMLLLHVWSRYRVLRLGYEVSELSRERETLLEENRLMRIELQVLTRPDRIEPIARRQLVLIPANPEQILYIRSADMPAPPVPATVAMQLIATRDPHE